MLRLLPLALLSLALACPGGGDGNDDDKGAKAGKDCPKQEDCAAGLLCLDHVCRDACDPGAEEEECEGDLVCFETPNSGVAGACVPIGATNLPCAENNACDEGLLCVQVEGEAAICRAPCNTGAPDCPDGFACAELSGGGANDGACIPES
jgi:hypothetical protein